MRKAILCLLLLTTFGFDNPKESAFGVGEWFKFRIHYGFVNAGYATLEVKEAVLHNEKVFHLIGKGQTTGISRFFFKVDDLYESYIDEKTYVPYQFLRKINEGGYTKNQEGFFTPQQNKIIVKDYKHKTEKTFAIPKNTQDILSAFYYLRNFATIDDIKPGEYIAIDMFFDEETTKFKLKFIGRENIKTKFGTVASMIFKPYVFSGRVFKEQESVTVWISDDDNKIPLRIQANLVVGSIKADLESYKGLRFPLKKRT
ncbi:DUF3108 domain-containing protein [Flavobacterium ammonificans]|uniref:DUF3108 domain-containing protein n=1 Tax=Flavobacterium ammonificans TaxID=1751056 RepID=A0ABM7UWK2_9FLAO|nr:DUF3108 domain-containing protein [Flavobacterium ammonificans]BDB52093.1 hypothetical protein GENT11_04050 [Flavobacterium ammonificans]